MAYPSAVQEAYKAELDAIRDKGIFKQERNIHSPQAANISVEFPSGQAPRRVVNLCSNNYLGLSSHPDVVAAAHRGLDERGYGMSSVRFICGTQDLHRELEHKLTEFLGTEDTILFPSCMDANGGVFEAVLNDQDVMIADRLVHASIVDGMRLCKAMQDTYKHADMKHLEQKLQEHQDKRVRLIITDGVFSMDGDLAPLDEIVALAEKYDAMVFVDDSHASGFMGKTGRGVHEHFGVVGKIDIITTTLGKGLGGASGGCVSGRREIVELCRQKARPYLFSNAVPPPIAAAAIKVLEIVELQHRAARPPRGEPEVLAPGGEGSRLRHQGRRQPDRPDHAVQREAEPGRRARPVRRGRLRHRLLLPGRRGRPGPHSHADVGGPRHPDAAGRARSVQESRREVPGSSGWTRRGSSRSTGSSDG